MFTLRILHTTAIGTPVVEHCSTGRYQCMCLIHTAHFPANLHSNPHNVYSEEESYARTHLANELVIEQVYLAEHHTGVETVNGTRSPACYCYSKVENALFNNSLDTFACTVIRHPKTTQIMKEGTIAP